MSNISYIESEPENTGCFWCILFIIVTSTFSILQLLIEKVPDNYYWLVVGIVVFVLISMPMVYLMNRRYQRTNRIVNPTEPIHRIYTDEFCRKEIGENTEANPDKTGCIPKK